MKKLIILLLIAIICFSIGCSSYSLKHSMEEWVLIFRPVNCWTYSYSGKELTRCFSTAEEAIDAMVENMKFVEKIKHEQGEK